MFWARTGRCSINRARDDLLFRDPGRVPRASANVRFTRELPAAYDRVRISDRRVAVAAAVNHLLAKDRPGVASTAVHTCRTRLDTSGRHTGAVVLRFSAALGVGLALRPSLRRLAGQGGE